MKEKSPKLTMVATVVEKNDLDYPHPDTRVRFETSDGGWFVWVMGRVTAAKHEWLKKGMVVNVEAFVRPCGKRLFRVKVTEVML